MQNLQQYLDSKGIALNDIEKSTNLPSEMISGLISGDVNILDINLGKVLLLSQYLRLPLSELAGYCALQQDGWKITEENGYYYLSFSIDNKKTRMQLAPISPTNTKYIKVIAATHYDCFLDSIIDAKRGQIAVFRKQVALEMKKRDASDCSINLIDNETLENMLDAGYPPQEAAAKLIKEGDFS